SIHDLGNQNKIAGQGNPVIHARVPTWLRTKHGTSDTVMKSWKRWLYWPTSPGQVKRRLADEFPGVDPALAIDAVIGSSS
ncbi:MAG: hypothetical protein VYD64_03210, partial [Pseudomonadota bacterium]|nr:hypothetical protein [Pseudomonadota bacterium]